MPLALNDDELCIVMDAAAPILPRHRDEFLREVARQLSACDSAALTYRAIAIGQSQTYERSSRER